MGFEFWVLGFWVLDFGVGFGDWGSGIVFVFCCGQGLEFRMWCVDHQVLGVCVSVFFFVCFVFGLGVDCQVLEVCVQCVCFGFGVWARVAFSDFGSLCEVCVFGVWCLG